MGRHINQAVKDKILKQVKPNSDLLLIAASNGIHVSSIKRWLSELNGDVKASIKVKTKAKDKAKDKASTPIARHNITGISDLKNFLGDSSEKEKSDCFMILDILDTIEKNQLPIEITLVTG